MTSVRRARPRWRARFVTPALLVVVGGVVGCSRAVAGPTCTLPLPDASAARKRAFDEFGRRAFAAVVRGAPKPLLLEDDALHTLFSPQAATAASALRVSTSLATQGDTEAAATLAQATYLGICVQRARLVAPGPPLGLRQPAFVFDRALVVGAEPGGGRMAAWVEGTFVHTDRGFFAVALQRLSSPRRDHADLDLAPCDLRFGYGTPRGVVVPVPDSY